MDSTEILETIERMKKYNRIKEKYQDKIKHRKDGRQVYVLINRKQIAAATEESLYDKLFAMEYGCENYSMKDVFLLWLVWKRDNTSVAGSTLRNSQYDWNRRFEGQPITLKPLRRLVPRDFIELFRQWTKNREMTQKEFNNLKSIINGIYSYAIDELEIVYRNPIREIDMRQFPIKPAKSRTGIFTLEDREKLLSYLECKSETGVDAMYSLAIQFDFYVTLRIGELKALKWSNIVDGQIYVEEQMVRTTSMNDDGSFSHGRYENVDHIKGNTDLGFRWIPLTKKALKILAKVRELNPDGKYIFMYHGKQLYTQTFNEHLRKYCKDVGIHSDDKASHDIRFTVASALYLGGVPLTEIQRLLGHTSLKMTLHYLRQILPKEKTARLMEECL